MECRLLELKKKLNYIIYIYKFSKIYYKIIFFFKTLLFICILLYNANKRIYKKIINNFAYKFSCKLEKTQYKIYTGIHG